MAHPHPVRTLALLTAATVLTACSAVDHAILSTENGTSRIFAGGPSDPPPPSIDLKSLTWQKLGASSAVQFAPLGGDGKAGTMRIALKVPAGEAVPAFWQEVPETYTVLSGSFVVEGIDGSGRPEHTIQGPGTFARVPARMIQHLSSTAAGDGMMLVTVYGEWKPNFVDAGLQNEVQRAAN